MVCSRLQARMNRSVFKIRIPQFVRDALRVAAKREVLLLGVPPIPNSAFCIWLSSNCLKTP